MLETSARLLKLLSLLQSPRDWSGTALADELGVGVRTVRRDVDKLRNLGYPVDAVPGVAGYRLGIGASLPPLLLDDEEGVAVAIGLRAAAAGSVAGIEESSVRALTKLEQVLPSRLRHRIRLLQSVAVTPTGVAAVAPDVVLAVAAACRYQARFILQAPAEVIADRIATAVGIVEPLDPSSCVLSVGSNSLDELTLYVGLLGYDFRVESPPELVEHVRTLSARLADAAS